MGAMALHCYSSMELKSRSFTSKEQHVAREPQVADPCPRPLLHFAQELYTSHHCFALWQAKVGR
jgi:hypothetical protein